MAKAHNLWLQAGELGDTSAFTALAMFTTSICMKRDTQKAKCYWELTAMGGDAEARYNLGIWEQEADKKWIEQ